MTKGVFEIFKEAVKLKSMKAKAAYLKEHANNFACRSVLQGCFHPAIKFLLPDSIPPYSETDGSQVETVLHSQARKFDIFIEGGRPVANQSKREMIFIEMLETVHPEDAKILLNMIQKKPPVKGLTEKVVKEAFPDLLPNE